MDRVKNVAKGGWHPTSIRSEHKHVNQVAGWVGHGKEPNGSLKATDHVSRPLTSLKDPDAFGPPPKNINFHGGAATSNAVAPDRRGMGAAIPPEDMRAEEQRAAQAAQKPAPPPIPYRANTSGLSTANLPKPPLRQIENGEVSATASPIAKPKPSLPPRLPPRQNSHPTTNTPSPPPDYSSATQEQPPQTSYLNQGALGRLGKAGVSVPGLGIGGGREEQKGQGSSQASNPWRNESIANRSSTSSPTATQTPSISGLQSRFGQMTTSPTSTSNQPSTPSQGTSFAQKQAALHTASQFRNDPSSITLSDARSSAATANNFRERHGEQVATGWKGANTLNKKYDVANRVNGIAGQNQNGSASPTREDGPITMRDSTASPTGAGSMPASPWANEPSHNTFRKAPPPPPVKRTGTGSSGAPPPVPMGSKPRT